MSGVSESINFLFNVLICGSFASFWFLQKIKIVGCLDKKETTIQSRTKSDIIDLMQITDHLTLAMTILVWKCYISIVKFFKTPVLMDVYLRMCVITTGNV